MRLKTDWTTHLHRIRERELEAVFGRCPASLFPRGLELGAGDGFQGRALKRWVRELISTDYHPDVLENEAGPGLRYEVCDAEHADRQFPPGSFELIFSSSMLEHVPDPQRVLNATRTLLAPGGVAVHVVPSVAWKVALFSLHLPALAAWTMERYLGEPPPTIREHANNLKTEQAPRSRWRLLWPEPHGVSPGHIAELLAFRRARWLREIEEAGLETVATIRGPVFSGHGFGFERIRALLERAGVSSETAFVVGRPGEASAYRKYFAGG